MEKLFIPVILGTTRPKRFSVHAAKFVVEVLSAREDVETELVDPKELSLPFDGNDEEVKDPRYSALTARADGFIAVFPEYNHGYPSTLKRVLDSELKNYNHKPIAFVGCSDGPWGGVRAIENLVGPVREMGLVACSVDAQFSKIPERFDEHGQIIEREKYEKRVNRLIDELLWMTRALKWGRENAGR